MNCFATSLRRRMARILTALAGSLAVTAATAQAALAQPWPQKVPSHLGPPVHIRSVVIGGPLGDARGQYKPASIFLDREWRTLIGLGGYFLAPEHHVIAVPSNGAIRDVRWALGDSSATHHDVLVLPASDLLNRGGGIGPLIDSFVDRRSTAHTIVAMPDGDLFDVQILPPNPTMIFVGGH
jgi:hypothetical protein